MQSLGYIIVHNEKILVLSRFVVKRIGRKQQIGYRALKIRKSGKDGSYYLAESQHLEGYPDELKSLKEGNVIHC